MSEYDSVHGDTKLTVNLISKQAKYATDYEYRSHKKIV